MRPKIIRTGIRRYEGTGVRKTEMATQHRKAYVPVTLDVDNGIEQQQAHIRYLHGFSRACLNIPCNLPYRL